MKFTGFILILFLSFNIFINLPSINASQTSSSNYNLDVDISSGGNSISSNNYKTSAITGVITGNSSSSSYKQSSGFIFCIPLTCSDLGYECGIWDNGCGKTLDCGTCASGYTCSDGTCIAIPTKAGGGAPEKVITGPNFTLSKDLIRVLIKQGESKREVIEIKNTGDTPLNISLKLENIEKFMAVSEKNFSLSKGKNKSIFIDIFAKEEEIPDAYIGKIIATGNNITKIINVIIEVKEKKPLFDVVVDVLSKKVLQGKNIKAKLKVFNLGDLRNIDIKIYYSIQDFNGKNLAFKEESIAIDKELNITGTLKVPENIPPGDYVFYFKASYLNISATSTETFEVVERKISLFSILLVFGIILMIAILIFIFIIFKRFFRYINKKREVKTEEIKVKPKEEIKPQKEIIEPKKKGQEKKETKAIKIAPKIKPHQKIKERLSKIIKPKIKTEKRILKKEKRVKRKLLKGIKKQIKKKKRKEKLENLKKSVERKKRELKVRKKAKKEARKSKKKKPVVLDKRKMYEDLLKKVVNMKKKKL